MSTASIIERDQELAAGRSGAGFGASDTEPAKPRNQLAGPGPLAVAGSDISCTSVTAAGATTEVSAADSFLFELVTAAHYHRARVTWFAGLHRSGMFLNVLFGTWAIAAVVKANTSAAIGVSMALAFVTAAGLAFDFAGFARKHEDARRGYHDLAAELEEGGDDEATVKRLRARMIRAAATEPVVFEAAEKVAYNSAIHSLGRDVNDEFVLTGAQRFWRHVWPYSGTKFPKRKDIAAKLNN